MAATETMPVGSLVAGPIREEQVKTTTGDSKAPVYDEDAACHLVWRDYERAKAFVESENTAYLLEWQETDILYQSPVAYRFERMNTGRPPRVPRFIVAKITRTMSRAIKRALFAEQYPFVLRPGSKSTQETADAWTYLLGVLLKRMKFVYQGGLQINGQTLFGTGLGKYGWQTRKVTKKIRRPKAPPTKINLPTGSETINTQVSDDFETVPVTTTESWPFYEYRRLGTTLLDPKWCTPDMPEESAGYLVDIDYVNFSDLQQMAQLECYKEKFDNDGKRINAGIPSEEVLKRYFFEKQQGSAPVGSQTADSMTSAGSMVAHAAGENRQTSETPLDVPLLLIERWDDRTVKTILVYDGKKLTIRNEEHDCGSMCHTACTLWPIDNAGYGMGTGRIVGADQRVNQGVLNEALKMIAYPMNAPIVYDATSSDNAPTQNVIFKLGGFWGLRPQAGRDVDKAVKFMEMPQIPADAWHMIEFSQNGAEEVAGADAQMAQGVLNGRQGATRSSFGAQRVAAMSDQNVAEPVESFAQGCLVPVLEFLIRMVKTKMPLQEIRDILKQKYSDDIVQAIKFEQFLDPDFEIQILAGQKLLAKQGIQQLLPFFMQIAQQPQLLEYLHQRGDTIDFEVIFDLLLQFSELTQQPDVFRKLTPRERVMVRQMNQGVQRVQGALATEQAKGKNKLAEIQAKGNVDLANKAAEVALEKTADGIPATRAAGLIDRDTAEQFYRQGVPDLMEGQ